MNETLEEFLRTKNNLLVQKTHQLIALTTQESHRLRPDKSETYQTEMLQIGWIGPQTQITHNSLLTPLAEGIILPHQIPSECEINQRTIPEFQNSYEDHFQPNSEGVKYFIGNEVALPKIEEKLMGWQWSIFMRRSGGVPYLKRPMNSALLEKDHKEKTDRYSALMKEVHAKAFHNVRLQLDIAVRREYVHADRTELMLDPGHKITLDFKELLPHLLAKYKI